MDPKGKLFLFIACSLDGYIAAHDNNLDFLSIVEDGDEDYGYHDFISRVDTVIVGRKTYDWVEKHASYPHTTKKSYVISTRPGEAKENLQFYNGDVAQLVSQLKEDGHRIYCEGGAEILHQLLVKDMVDEMIISYIPVLLGGGTPLFKPGTPRLNYKLISVQPFPKGLVQLKYERDQYI
ncbi:MAG TPA: dihydrofolate reductase family protein [Saprospiraceae bacterium]|nr:dihydrofolate reductase family protein [Saprospiraceae bacterium]